MTLVLGIVCFPIKDAGIAITFCYFGGKDIVYALTVSLITLKNIFFLRLFAKVTNITSPAFVDDFAVYYYLSRVSGEFYMT